MILYGLIRRKILYNNLLLSETYSLKFSTGGEVRTPDTRFSRPVLYQLSYSRKNQFPKPYDRELIIYIYPSVSQEVLLSVQHLQYVHLHG